MMNADRPSYKADRNRITARLQFQVYNRKLQVQYLLEVGRTNYGFFECPFCKKVYLKQYFGPHIGKQHDIVLLGVESFNPV